MRGIQLQIVLYSNMCRGQHICCASLPPMLVCWFKSWFGLEFFCRDTWHFLELVIMVCLLVGCLMSQQHASVSQGRICSDNFTCCHTEVEVADQTFYLTQSQNTDTGLTSPSADPITPGAWQGSHWSANF